jgi:hypothetical protein
MSSHPKEIATRNQRLTLSSCKCDTNFGSLANQSAARQLFKEIDQDNQGTLDEKQLGAALSRLLHTQRYQRVRFGLMLDQNVNQDCPAEWLPVPPPQRGAQHHVRFNVAVIALDKGGANHAQVFESNHVDHVRPEDVQQILNVEGVLQQQLETVFVKLPHDLLDAWMKHLAILMVCYHTPVPSRTWCCASGGYVSPEPAQTSRSCARVVICFFSLLFFLLRLPFPV